MVEELFGGDANLANDVPVSRLRGASKLAQTRSITRHMGGGVTIAMDDISCSSRKRSEDIDE